MPTDRPAAPAVPVDAPGARTAGPAAGRAAAEDGTGDLRWWDSVLIPVIALGALVVLGILGDLAQTVADALT